MAAKTLNDFTLAGTAASDDFVVGFDTAVANGERKWTVATIANAVSGVMTPELNNAFFNTTDVIPIAKGGTGQTAAFAGLVALANGGPSTAGKFLKVNAGNTALEYDTIDLSTADVTGVLPVANGGTGGTTGGSGNIVAWAIWTETSTGFTTNTIGASGFNVSSITKSSGTDDLRIVNFTNPINGPYAVIASGDLNTDGGNTMSNGYGIEANRINSTSCAVMWYQSNASGIPNMFFSVAVIQ